jgi:hypothetical protein
MQRMTESIAKELNECLCAIVINTITCLRMLSANPPNVEGARETARRTIRSSNRAAEAVSHPHGLFSETSKHNCRIFGGGRPQNMTSSRLTGAAPSG